MQVAERVAAGNFTDQIDMRRRDELGRLLKSLAVMQASLKARADEELTLKSAKDQTHAEQVSRRQRIEAEIETFRSSVTSVLSQYRPDDGRTDRDGGNAVLDRPGGGRAIGRDGLNRR